MNWLETLFLADVLSSDKKTARKKIKTFVWVFMILIGSWLFASLLMMGILFDTCPEDEECQGEIVQKSIISKTLDVKKMQSLKNIFIESIAPKTLQDGYKVDNMDKAISEEVTLLKEKQNPLYEYLVLMQQNYYEFLVDNGKPCEIQKKGIGKNKIIGTLEVENPYHASIQSMIDNAIMGKNVEIVLPLEKKYVCVKKAQ